MIFQKCCLWLLTGVAAVCFGVEPLRFQQNIVPGADAVAGERVVKTAIPSEFQSAGTMTMYLKPVGWGSGEGKWHFFLNTGKLDKETPHIYLYSLLNGNLRFLWAKNAGKGEVGEIVTTSPVDWRDGEWKQIAVTWQVKNGKSTELKLYIDGKLAGSRFCNFVLSKEEFPANWILGDLPNWNPRSDGQTVLGRTVIYPEVLSQEELQRLANEKFSSDGAMVYLDREFIPGTSGVIAGRFVNLGADMVRFKLLFRDEEGREISAGNVGKKVVEQGVNRDFVLEFEVPTIAAETELRLYKLDGTPLDWQLRYTVLPRFLPKAAPHGWNSAWIWGQDAMKPEEHIYFRKTFELKDVDQIERAVCQWATDDRSEVFINGFSVGKVNSWAVPMVAFDVKPFLKNGRNVIAADGFNYSGEAGFLCELALLYQDGRLLKIGSGDDWKLNSQLLDGYTLADFDDGDWDQAIVKCTPPQNPYGATPYFYAGKIESMKMVSADIPETVAAGAELKLRAGFKGNANVRLRDDIYWIVDYKGSEIYRSLAGMRYEDGVMKLSGDVRIPQAALPGEYVLKLDSTVFKFNDGAPVATFKVTKTPQEVVPLVAKLERIAGAPRLTVNGEVEPMMLYRNAIPTRPSTVRNRFIADFPPVGVKFAEINVDLKKLWQKDGSIDWDYLDREIQSVLFYAPDAKLMVFFNVDAPAWFLKEFPGERMGFADRSFDQVSYASSLYRERAGAILRQVAEGMKQRPYYHALLGFGLDGGEDGQWMQWTTRNLTYLGDYSRPMVDYFHSFLQNKYGSVEEFNRKTGKNVRSWEEIAIPAPEERSKAKGGLFFDPVAEALAVDFGFAFSEAVVDNLLHYAEVLKSATDDDKLVAAYYGKFFSIAGFHEWGEFSIGRVLRSPDIDYLIAVEYLERSAGRPHSVSALLGSYRLHNKIFVDEADLRTYLGGTKGWGYSGSLFDTASMIRKMFMLSFVKNHGIHWYDLHGGAFAGEGILQSIGRVKKIAAEHKLMPAKNAEIAVIVDEKSLPYTSSNLKNISRNAILHQQNGVFYRLGADFDMYFLDDLGHPDFPKYKMYIFLNAWQLSGERLKLVEALKKDQALLVWLFNSGVIGENGIAAQNTAKLTGIEMEQAQGSMPLSMSVSPEVNEKAPFMKSIASGYCSGGEGFQVVYPVDPAAERFGTMVGNEKIKPMAYKDMGDWKSFYSAVPVLPVDLYRELARSAGVHIASNDPSVMLYFGDSMLGVHTGNAGIKTIFWPHPATFTDAISGEVVGKETDVLRLPMKKNETRILTVRKKE